MRSEATTVKEYLGALPADRRKALAAVRRVIRASLPKGYEEVMNWGMITYQVPLKTYPDTYNGQPLMYAALASQKNHMSVHLSGIYSDAGARRKFEAAYKAAGKRLNAGKSCVRFRKLEDLALPLIGNTIASVGVKEFVNREKKVRGGQKRKKH